MKKKIAFSNTRNIENSNKNIKNLNLNNGIENFNIVFKHKEKRSIKNGKNNKLIKILLPIILFAILLILGIIMLILFLFRKKNLFQKSKFQFLSSVMKKPRKC